MRKILLFFLLCVVLGCNFHSVKSERYGLASERGQNDDLNMEDYYEDYGDDDVDAKNEYDARRADANPRARWQGDVHVLYPNVGFPVSKKWRK